ncbi:CLE03 protein [Medicago truncatula]|uniref:CLE03 protein n=1 Tax=Medicago truncatula TaxID=3880 RepID=A0A072V5R3_MEDTR|nr:CLE03 protein [Medicago truncatula]
MPTTGFFHTPPYTQQRNPPTHANNIMRDNLLRDIFMFSPDTILQASSPKDFTFSLMIFRPKTFVNLSLQLQVQEHTLTKDDAKKRSNEVATSTNEESVQNLNTTKGNRISDLQKHPKGRNSRASKPLFQWKNKIFNASEHEVPSGPNPISNR